MIDLLINGTVFKSRVEKLHGVTCAKFWRWKSVRWTRQW